MSALSKHLNEKQLAGLNKMGQVMLPGYDDLPPFSETNCVRHVDRIIDHMPETDLNDLKLLLTLMGFFPTFLVRGFLAFLELSGSIPGFIGSLLRFARIGVRGLVMTLYYSDPAITDKLGYKVSVYTEDMRGNGSHAGSKPSTSETRPIA